MGEIISVECIRDFDPDIVRVTIKPPVGDEQILDMRPEDYAVLALLPIFRRTLAPDNMTTRGDQIQRAFEEIAIAAYVFDLSGDELASALRAHETMLLSWVAMGALSEYIVAPQGPALSDEMLTPVWADNAISLNLALELAPSYGKTPSTETKRKAKLGYNLCVSKNLTMPRVKSAPVTIHGGGEWRSRFYPY